MNPIFQADCNSELKWGRYDRLKQGYWKCMGAQWCQLWAKITATSNKFPRACHLSLWSLGSQEFNASNGSQFGVEMREIWPIEEMLYKEHVVTWLHMGPIPFSCLGWILGLFLGLIFGGNWAFWVFYFN